MEASQRAGADPAGIALLLAGPAAKELWSGPPIRVGAPRRTGTGFMVDLAVGEASTGRLHITAAGTGRSAADLRLVLCAPADEALAIADAGHAFLDRLVAAAQARSSAA